MIELIRYSQDVPVNGNGGEALSFLVLLCNGKEFRVRVTEQTIADIVQFMETLRADEDPPLKKRVTDGEMEWDEEPVLATAHVSDEEAIPSL